MGSSANLISLTLDNCGLKEIDLSGCNALTEVSLNNNGLTALNLENTDIQKLSIHNNNFAKLNAATLAVSSNTKLKWVHAEDLSKCQSIDVSHIKTLEGLNIANGVYSKVTIGKNLKYLTLSSTDLESLSKKTLQAPSGSKLKELICYRCNLKKVDIRRFTKLTNLDLEGNKLTEVNLTGNLKLKKCNLSYNPLKKLIASKKSSDSQKKLYKKIAKECGAKLTYQ